MYNKLKKIRAAIFISGRGSNMESLIKASNYQKFPAIIVLIITNNEFAPGIQLAKKYNIPFKIFDKKKFNKANFEETSQKVLLDTKLQKTI